MNTDTIPSILLHESRQEERRHNRIYEKSLDLPKQTRPTNTTRGSKIYIATMSVSDSHKKNLIIAYNRFSKFSEIQWNMPRYTQDAKNIALPTNNKLSMLIANAPKTLRTKLQMSKETGLRPVDLCRLKVKNIDLEHKTVNPTTAKGGNPRTIPMSANLTAKIQERILVNNLTPTTNCLEM